MNRILVFGASGDTGKYFVKYFVDHNEQKEYEIIAIGTRNTNFFSKIGVRYIQIDITNPESFSQLPTDVYAVVDLAGAMPARMEGYDPYKYININITGTLNILEFCRKCNVDRILFSQSFGDIKDNAENNIMLKTDSPKNFSYKSDHTVYVLTKNFAVDLIENYHQMYGIKRFIFRLPTIYLWSQTDFYYVNGIKCKIGYRKLIDEAIAGEPIEVWGDQTRLKDMVYVKDFCQMLYKAIFVDRNEGYYNVGCGKGTSLIDQITGIVDVFSNNGNRSQLIMCPQMKNAPQYIMDISSAVDELGYKPKYDDYKKMLIDFKKEMNIKFYTD